MSTIPVRQPIDRGAASPTLRHAPRTTVVLLDQEVHIPPGAYTLAGFRASAHSDEFPERGRISYLDGEVVVEMSPEELQTHSAIKGEVSYGIAHLNKKGKLGRLFLDRALLTNAEANLCTEPDATFVTWAGLESGKVRLVSRDDEQGKYLELEGSPDWVLEIVSDSSVRKDTRQLRERYCLARVQEYWLIAARGEEIDFQILVWQELGYEPAATMRGGWQVSAVFQRCFRLVRQRDRLNFWEYTLQGKPLR